MICKAVSCRVTPKTRCSSQVGSEIVFCTLGVFNLEFREICKFVLQTRISIRFCCEGFRLVESNRKTNLKQRRRFGTSSGSMAPKNRIFWAPKLMFSMTPGIRNFDRNVRFRAPRRIFPALPDAARHALASPARQGIF